TSSPTAVPASTNEKNASEKLWTMAMADLQAGRFDAALKLFENFSRLYPKNVRMPYAVLASGLIKYRLTQYREAALYFNQVIDIGQKKQFTALAWFGQGAAFAMLKQNEDAK